MAARCDNFGIYGSTKNNNEQCHTALTSSNHMDLWHRCLVHESCHTLEIAISHTAGNKSINERIGTCYPCKLGKAQLKPFHSSSD